MTADLHDRLNWQQACTLLGIGKTKFYELVNSGVLASRRVGKRGIWVSRKDCLRLVTAWSADASRHTGHIDAAP